MPYKKVKVFIRPYEGPVFDHDDCDVRIEYCGWRVYFRADKVMVFGGDSPIKGHFREYKEEEVTGVNQSKSR